MLGIYMIDSAPRSPSNNLKDQVAELLEETPIPDNDQQESELVDALVNLILDTILASPEMHEKKPWMLDSKSDYGQGLIIGGNKTIVNLRAMLEGLKS